MASPIRLASAGALALLIAAPAWLASQGPPAGPMVLQNAFRQNSAVLLPAAMADLDSIASTIQATPNARWEIGGHTSRVGTAARNLEVSQQRAEAVKAYLVSQGVPEASLTAVGYGSRYPVASSRTAAGRARNMRVEIRRLPSGAPPAPALARVAPSQLAGPPAAAPVGASMVLLRAFRQNSAVLLPTAMADLDNIAAAIQATPDARWEIGGHTSRVGTVARNLEVSQQRAEAVKAYLVSQGVPAASLTAVGYGSRYPVASNRTASGRAQNMRVEIRRLPSGAPRAPALAQVAPSQPAASPARAPAQVAPSQPAAPPARALAQVAPSQPVGPPAERLAQARALVYRGESDSATAILNPMLRDPRTRRAQRGQALLISAAAHYQKESGTDSALALTMLKLALQTDSSVRVDSSLNADAPGVAEQVEILRHQMYPPAANASSGMLLGPWVGLNFATFNASNWESGWKWQTRTVFTIGAAFEPALSSHIFLRVGAFYSMRGAGIDQTQLGFGTGTLKSSYVEVPVLVGYRFAAKGARIRPYALAGGQLSYLTSCSVQDNTGKTFGCNAFFPQTFGAGDLGVTLGGGVALAEGPGTMMVDARYLLGLTKPYASANESLRNAGVTIVAGYMFPVGH